MYTVNSELYTVCGHYIKKFKYKYEFFLLQNIISTFIIKKK